MTQTYYVGDLCYVLNSEEWDTVCNTADFYKDQNTYNEEDGYECENFLDADLFDWANWDAARPYYIFRTFYGDGVYNDLDGNPYSVDSGTIGCIRTDFITAKDKLEHALTNGLGHLHEFDEEFCDGNCFYEDGVIGFGHVEIATA